MSIAYRVALAGFSLHERRALSSLLRSSSRRTPHYEQVADVKHADFVIADTDFPGVLEQIVARRRVRDTVFFGPNVPEDALVRLHRPLDGAAILLELDSMVSVLDPHKVPPTLSEPIARNNVPRISRPGSLYRRASDSKFSEMEASVAQHRPEPVHDQVLVVDDSVVALHAMAGQLEQLGLRAHVAVNSRKAMELLAERDFVAVLIDTHLGDDSDVDGLTLCRYVKQEHRQRSGVTPVVVTVTSNTNELDRVRSNLAGCDAWVVKPVGQDQLEKALLSSAVLRQPDPPPRKRRHSTRSGTL